MEITPRQDCLDYFNDIYDATYHDMLRYVLMERPIAPPKPAPEALLPDDPLDLLSFGKRK